MNARELQFVFVGNNIAVDFLNTEIVSRDEPVDLLADEIDLTQWARQAGFVLTERVTAADLNEALVFRRALKEVFLAHIDRLPPPPKALALVNRYLAAHATPQQLRYDQNRQHFELVAANESLTLPMMLTGLADAAAGLLASPQAERLKRCHNTHCILIFVDTSRSGKRRWCSMETCGNRAKVAKHYRNSLGR